MRRFLLIATVTSLLLSLAVGQNAAAPKPKLGPSAALLASWNEIGRKLITMAEDFPEDNYDFKPTPAQKSFAEQLLHVAGSNDLFTDVALGKKPVDDESREHFKTKADVVAYVKKSYADGAAVIQKKGDSGMLEMVVEADALAETQGFIASAAASVSTLQSGFRVRFFEAEEVEVAAGVARDDLLDRMEKCAA